MTWLATLEMSGEQGLHVTLQKYFNWKACYVIPEINGKVVPLPLLGGYWICALLTLNLICGGIVRARKGWKHAGNLIAHSGIVFMLIAGGVAHHFEVRGTMAMYPGEASDVAVDYHEHVVEVAELKENGEVDTVHVIRGKYLMDLTDGKSRTVRLPNLPFDLELAGYVVNAKPLHVMDDPPDEEELVVDDYYLFSEKKEKDAEMNRGGCYARIIDGDGGKSDPFILCTLSYHPQTVVREDRTFVVSLHKRFWPVPVTVRVNEFTAEFHPGTRKAKKYVSEVTRIDDSGEVDITISMNKPMRYDGMTFYQASFGPRGAGPDDRLYTVLEVVENPSDKWPEYALYIVTLGLLVAFVTKLVQFLLAQSRNRAS